ncbi:uncharacterized protein IL334_005609 [Kwoniella shivajii]|uniref:Uncharacterized protein n=1 Tax=Kwoniella shivajii TaxID=564305 RepID=A0ABZ1D6Q4_9TREE|nr:hypothetical protein IL334_005609 [Kwoniella shivajii]
MDSKTSSSVPAPSVKEKQSSPTRKSSITPSHIQAKISSPTPQNTPSENVFPLGIGKRHSVSGGGKPINAANAIMGIGRGLPPHPHAATPGNTLNSLEKITSRIANHLVVEENQDVNDNKIAPSYESSFSAGLGDLNRRLSSPAIIRSPSSPIVSPTASLSMISGDLQNGSFKNEWPTTFSDLDNEADSVESSKNKSERDNSVLQKKE